MGSRKRREEKRLLHFSNGAETSVIAARSSPEVRGDPGCRESFKIRSLQVEFIFALCVVLPIFGSRGLGTMPGSFIL